MCFCNCFIICICEHICYNSSIIKESKVYQLSLKYILFIPFIGIWPWSSLQLVHNSFLSSYNQSSFKSFKLVSVKYELTVEYCTYGWDLYWHVKKYHEVSNQSLVFVSSGYLRCMREGICHIKIIDGHKIWYVILVLETFHCASL